MAQKITLSNRKGGVGKTTTTVHFAYGLAEQLDRPVLLVDTDSQGHSSHLTTGIADHGPDHSLAGVLRATARDQPGVLLESIVASRGDARVHVLPASQSLEAVQSELLGQGDGVYRLRSALRAVEDNYAAIVFDTQPAFSLLTQQALAAADWVYIPLEPRYLDTIGLQAIIQQIGTIRTRWSLDGLRVGGLLLTKYDRRMRGHVELAGQLRSQAVFGPLLRGVIPVNEVVTYAQHQGMSLYAFAPKSGAAQAYGQMVRGLAQRHFGVRR